ncbi:ABC transporter permease [Cellvibrio mixtus]|uniref:ABC transporter permease n=1 Tax=Cellvibrio mixtus TaxID=39650 RepID=UPI00058746D9|nr:FtsX-like permease family protein [Cellvibrio mixtus]
MFSLPPVLKPLLRKKLTVVLLGLQIALITMLISNLAHILNEMDNYYKSPTGIDDKHLLCFTLRNPSGTKGIALADGLRDLEKIKAIPGVVDVASVDATPLDHEYNLKTGSFNTSLEQNNEQIAFVRSNVSPNALDTLGLRLLAGRKFESSDMAFTYKSYPQVTIITRALATALFGENNNAIGKMVYEKDKQYEIIGVVSDWKGFAPQIYRFESTAFFPEYNEINNEFRYLIRTHSPEVRSVVIQAVEQYLMHQYPQGLIFYADKLDAIVNKYMNRGTLALLKLITLILTLASIIAIAGQAYFSVHQRRKQLGVLRALGATRTKLIAQILLENAAIVSVGLSLGVALAMLLSHFFYKTTEIVALSPWFLLTTACGIFAICLLSAAIPALQAGKISPSLATRTL